MSLLDRIIDRANFYFYHVKRPISVASRSLALIALAAMLTSVIPTLADESESVQSGVEFAETPQAEDQVPASIDESNQEAPAPSTSESPSESPAPETSEDEATEEEEEEISVAESQPRISFRFPNNVAHDPRANVAFLPTLGMSGGGTGLLCISFNGLIDVFAKNQVNDVGDGSLLVSGDLTSRVRISGEFNEISQLINTNGGLKLVSSTGRLNWSSVSFGYVELTGASTDPDFCRSMSSTRTIGFRALGIQLDNVKTKVDFNKPKGS